jgi:(hydroxyamino)benzene mutase
MTRDERVVCVAGLCLFLLALLQGFFIPAFERVDAARAAHATALGAGTFLLAVGLLWPKLAFGARASAVFSKLLAASLYALAIGLNLGATVPVGGTGLVPAAATAFNAVGGAVLILALVAVLVACRGKAVT